MGRGAGKDQEAQKPGYIHTMMKFITLRVAVKTDSKLSPPNLKLKVIFTYYLLKLNFIVQRFNHRSRRRNYL